MPRVPLIDEAAHPELNDLVGQLRSGRRGRLLKIYSLLLHSPAVAAAWFGFSNAVRWQTELDGRLRELVIIRVAELNGADYVVGQHIPVLAAAEGLTEADWSALTDWRASNRFSERERAALAYADAMTLSVAVPDDVYDEVARHFAERPLVELTVLIAAYAMNSRVTAALRLEPEAIKG
jgi:alkylhydroperoxidase family enzyme